LASTSSLNYTPFTSTSSILLSPLFFSNDTTPTEIYTLSLHDALPISKEPLFGNTYVSSHELGAIGVTLVVLVLLYVFFRFTPLRSEEHTSELQSRSDLVCRLLLEKKKT